MFKDHEVAQITFALGQLGYRCPEVFESIFAFVEVGLDVKIISTNMHLRIGYRTKTHKIYQCSCKGFQRLASIDPRWSNSY